MSNLQDSDDVKTQEYVPPNDALVYNALLNAVTPSSRAQLLMATNLSVELLRSVLKNLVKEGKVIETGSKKGRKYRLADRNVV